MGADLTEDEVESDTARVFPALDRTVQMFYEGQSDPGKRTSSEYKYDLNGNITDYIDHGDDTRDDDLHATITYHNYPDKYLIGPPEHITVKDVKASPKTLVVKNKI